MTAPGLFRSAFARAAGWRLLLLFAVASAVPALLAALPVWSFLSAQLDHALRAAALARALDAETLGDLLRAQAAVPGGAAALPAGLSAGALAALLLAPVHAGAALAAARTGEPLPLRELLRGAGEHYGRLLRMAVVAVLPLGLAGALSAGVLRLGRQAGERALTEGAAHQAHLAAWGAAAALAWLAHLTLDAGRAQLAVRPSRSSALLAWGAGLRLLRRRPLAAGGLGLAGTAAGLGGALVAAALRQRLLPGLPGLWLAPVAAAFVGWGHGARLVGLAHLGRADEEGRARRRAEALRAASAPPPAPPTPPEPPPAGA